MLTTQLILKPRTTGSLTFLWKNKYLIELFSTVAVLSGITVKRVEPTHFSNCHFT
jgi:hypothetical protein